MNAKIEMVQAPPKPLINASSSQQASMYGAGEFYQIAGFKRHFRDWYEPSLDFSKSKHPMIFVIGPNYVKLEEMLLRMPIRVEYPSSLVCVAEGTA